MERRRKIVSDLRPTWAIEADKTLIERRITKTEMADDLGFNCSYLRNVMAGVAVQRSNAIRDAVCEYLGITIDSEWD